MNTRTTLALSALALSLALPGLANAAAPAAVTGQFTVYNSLATSNLSPNFGFTINPITVTFYSGPTTACNTVVLGYRGVVNQQIGGYAPGSTTTNNVCQSFDHVNVAAGVSPYMVAAPTGYPAGSTVGLVNQIYANTPTTLSVDGTKFFHAYSIVDTGTGTAGTGTVGSCTPGTPAGNGSTPPFFDSHSGSIICAGTIGVTLMETALLPE